MSINYKPKEFTNKVNDIGKDSGGIIRQIARDVTIPSIFVEGSYDQLQWYQILALLSKLDNEKIKINLADSILIDNNEVLLYTYTDLEGNISKKPTKFNNLDKISKEFNDMHEILERKMKLKDIDTTNYNNIAVLHTTNQFPNIIRKDLFDMMCSMRQFNQENPCVLQFYIPSKGKLTSSSNRTFKTSYWLDRTAKSLIKTEKLDINNKILGSNNSSKTNLDKKSNSEMEKMVIQIINKIQVHEQCRVVRFICEFVEDFTGKIWLVRVGECLIASEKLQSKASTDQFKALRTGRIADLGEENTSDGERANSPNRFNGYIRSKPSDIGRHSDERVELRLKKGGLPPSDDIVREILNSSQKKRSSSKQSERLSTSPIRNRSPTNEIENYHAMQVPNARLGIEVPIVDSTAILGSTQIQGCQGDFCNFDVEYFENEEVLNNDDDLNKFSGIKHKKTMSKKVNMKNDDSTDFNQVITEMMKAKPKQLKKKHNDTGRPSLLDVLEQGNSIVSDITNDGTESITSNSNSMYKIPFKIIIQTRQEMPLVKLLLKRHKRGEVGDYVNEDSFNDLAIGTKLPAHYYKDVPCCMNCFKVYNIIDDAREKALRKISKRREKETNRSLSPPTHRIDTSTTLLPPPKPVEELLISDEAKESLQAAIAAIDSLTKLDIAEIRTMVKPPAAVEVTIEAVMCLLIGKVLPYNESRKILANGESLLQMFKDFKLEDVSDSRLLLAEAYVDNRIFRPENVLPISFCASKFCSWVLGVVQAARWQRGIGHIRTDMLKTSKKKTKKSKVNNDNNNENIDDLVHINQKVNRSVSKSIKENPISREPHDIKKSKSLKGLNSPTEKKLKKSSSFSESSTVKLDQVSMTEGSLDETVKITYTDLVDNGIDDSAYADDIETSQKFTQSIDSIITPNQTTTTTAITKKRSKRDKIAIAASQKKATERLASQNKTEGNLSLIGQNREIICADGITKMPYIVLGTLSLQVKRCNFLVIHDFFDTCDATAILFKPIMQRHDGSQIITFNYPGQANTVWPRLSAAERQRGAKEPILNNDWIADRIHELLQHAEMEGDILLSSPFHIVGIGNGAAIAAAFCQRWGGDKRYSNSLRSLVSFNGFLYPDPQLTSILHTASQVFETTPHTRPDIPVSYWCRFIFSEEYLNKMNPNLILNLYTAVSNPITNDGRSKIVKGCLQHRDIRNGLNPDRQPSMLADTTLSRVQIPVICIQSTEDMLVNPANVDPFLAGRSAKHLWSHQLNMISHATLNTALDPTGGWVGKMSYNNSDYQKFSILGRNGLRMLLDTLNNPRGAFVMWIRAGHHLQQENKASILDVIDALACPNEDYLGFQPVDDPPSITNSNDDTTSIMVEKVNETAKMESLFKIKPPKQVIITGKKVSIVDDTSKTINDDTIDTETPSNESKNNLQIEIQDVQLETKIEDKTEHTVKVIVEEKKGSKIEQKIDMKPPKKEKIIDKQDEEIVVKTISTQPVNILNNIIADAFVSAPIKSASSTLKQSKDNNIIASPIKTLKIEDEVDNSSLFSPVKTKAEMKSEQTLLKNPVTNKHQPEVPSTIAISNIPTKEHNIKLQSNEGTIIPSLTYNDDYASKNQRETRKWVEAIPDLSTTLELEADLQKKQKQFYDLQQEKREKLRLETEMKLENFEKEQEERRKVYEEEDKKILDKLQYDLEVRRRERDEAEKQRRLEMQAAEEHLIASGIVTKESETIPVLPVEEMPPLRYEDPPDLPSMITDGNPSLENQLSTMEKDAEAARKKGIMSLEDYERVKGQMFVNQIERDKMLRKLAGDEQQDLILSSVNFIQRVGRGYNGRKKARKIAEEIRRKRYIDNL